MTTPSGAAPADDPAADPAADHGERPSGERPPADRIPGDRPPGERLPVTSVASDPGATSLDDPSPATRAVAYGLVAAVLGGLLLWVFAAILAFSAGLLVVAFFLGRIVGLSVRTGAGGGLSSEARTSISILWSLGAITAAMVATWLFAGLSGGVLGLGEYLAETLGPIVPLEYMIATLAAWWTSR